MRRLPLTVLASLFVTTATAHTGLGDTSGFGHGFGHPFSGVDHVLAMLAVGLFASLLGRRALWLVPLSFVAMMGLGGALALAGITIPLVEAGIALSLVALGVAVALHLDMPVAVAMVFVGFFAIFHGHAHGAEMPDTVSGLGYGVGFIIATAALHVVGIGIGLAVRTTGEPSARWISQIAGAGVAIVGGALLVGA